MIGTAFAATATGSSTPRAVAHRAVARATTTPVVVPIASPPRASMSVARADGSSPNRGELRFSIRAETIADGRGRTKPLRPSAVTATSQPMIPPANTSTAGR